MITTHLLESIYSNYYNLLWFIYFIKCLLLLDLPLVYIQTFPNFLDLDLFRVDLYTNAITGYYEMVEQQINEFYTTTSKSTDLYTITRYYEMTEFLLDHNASLHMCLRIIALKVLISR